MVTQAAIEQYVKDALDHLYDAVSLTDSPLITLLGLRNRPSPVSSLRDSLEEAIKALEVTSGSPGGPRERRYYQVLYYRYVQQFTQADVATKLSMSERHLRREQATAIGRLAQHIGERYRLFDRPGLSGGSGEAIPSDEEANQVEREVLALSESLVERWAELEPIVGWAVGLAQPLACSHGVTLNADLSAATPLALVPPAVLKQCILDLLAGAIRSVPGGAVGVRATDRKRQVAIEVEAKPSDTCPASLPADTVDVPRRLVEHFGGRVEMKVREGTRSIVLVLPCIREAVVLAIEDSADTLQLWERYLRGSPCRLVSVSQSTEALQTAAQLRPELIVLDVMMPGLDGWELLHHLQQHPATHNIPVVVCTVHPQADLARAMGAAGFLQKPVTRRTFRDAVLGRISAATLAAPPG